MSIEIRNTTTPAGDPVTTITLTGTHDIARFADRMLEWQCEFGAAGRGILRSLRRRLGRERFDNYVDYLGLPHAKAHSRRPTWWCVMTAPCRIQRKRIKGWRLPEGAVYVGRPTPYGNPFTVMNGGRQGWLVWDDRDRLGFVTFNTSGGFVASFANHDGAHRHAVKLYRKHMFRQMDLTPLRGKDLACWCPPDIACHADVLLELANGGGQ